MKTSSLVRATTYSFIALLGVVPFLAHAADGLFGTYFQRMIGTGPCATGYVLTGFATSPYGTRTCTLLSDILDDAIGSLYTTSASPGEAMLGFNPDGSLRFGSVNWINSIFGISYAGNVGIGTATPLARLDVAGKIRMTPTEDTDAAEIVATKGYVDLAIQSYTGSVPPATADEVAKLLGFKEEARNFEEDIYAPAVGATSSTIDTCNNSKTTQYSCLPSDNKSCVDVMDSCDDIFCAKVKRNVTCIKKVILVKQESELQTVTGIASITSMKTTGNGNEWCNVNVNLPSCSGNVNIVTGEMDTATCRNMLISRISSGVNCSAYKGVKNVTWNTSTKVLTIDYYGF